MRIHHYLIIAGLGAALAAPVHAQSVKEIGDKIHHGLKKAGNTVKEDAGEVGSATHHALKKAGNATKTEAGKVTGIHKVGGSVGKAARSVSRKGKKVGRSAKGALKSTSSEAHNDLTKVGKDTKAAIKP